MPKSILLQRVCYLKFGDLWPRVNYPSSLKRDVDNETCLMAQSAQPNLTHPAPSSYYPLSNSQTFRDSSQRAGNSMKVERTTLLQTALAKAEKMMKRKPH